MAAIVIGSAVIVAAATITAVPVMKNAAKEGYKMTIKEMEKDDDFECIAIGEVSYTYKRSLLQRSTTKSRQILSSIARMKQNKERIGTKRILVIIRQKNNGSVNFILLKPLLNKKGRIVDECNPFKGYSIDHNLKSNQRGIVDSSSLRVTKKSSNTFQLEDKKYRTLQTHRKILEIRIRSRASSEKENINGTELSEILDSMADTGSLPKQLSKSYSSLSFALSEAVDDEHESVCSLSTVSSSPSLDDDDEDIVS